MAEVCLVLEGTYPYVFGGVSSCVHQLIKKLPAVNFSIVYIGARSDEFLKLKYDLPSNITGIQEVFLFDSVDSHQEMTLELNRKELEALEFLHKAIHKQQGRMQPLTALEARWLSEAIEILFPPTTPEPRLMKALGSKGVWKLLQKEYAELGERIPFIDFFYTWRSTHLPLYRILGYRFPRAELYHTMSTGYAGLAGLQAARQNNAPLLTTEHGIYAHERAIEISDASWLYSAKHRTDDFQAEGLERLKGWWVQMFRNMSRMTYGFSSNVITLYEANRRRQLYDGVLEDRTMILPNGIGRDMHGHRRVKESWQGPDSKRPFQLGFVGRVVQIKELITLIKAVRSIYEQYKNIECQIIGPTDEEPEYYQKCIELIQVLELEKVIKFVGRSNTKEVYPNLDCLLLTSISEAQPLVILEANLAGLPVVSTRVGSCPDLLEGWEEADKVLGPSGYLAPIGNSEEIARQTLKIIRSPDIWEKMSLTGVERVSRFYHEDRLTERYHILYQEHIARVNHTNDLAPGVLPWQE
jgi:glycosyltransferase involved in cell wall biosynthesis